MTYETLFTNSTVYVKQEEVKKSLLMKVLVRKLTRRFLYSDEYSDRELGRHTITRHG